MARLFGRRRSRAPGMGDLFKPGGKTDMAAAAPPFLLGFLGNRLATVVGKSFILPMINGTLARRNIANPHLYLGATAGLLGVGVSALGVKLSDSMGLSISRRRGLRTSMYAAGGVSLALDAYRTYRIHLAAASARPALMAQARYTQGTRGMMDILRAALFLPRGTGSAQSGMGYNRAVVPYRNVPVGEYVGKRRHGLGAPVPYRGVPVGEFVGRGSGMGEYIGKGGQGLGRYRQAQYPTVNGMGEYIGKGGQGLGRYRQANYPTVNGTGRTTMLHGLG